MFLLLTFLFTYALTFTWQQATMLSCWHNHREHFEVRCFAQGHFDIWTGGAGDPTPNPRFSGQPALPPEQQPPLWCYYTTLLYLYKYKLLASILDTDIPV